MTRVKINPNHQSFGVFLKLNDQEQALHFSLRTDLGKYTFNTFLGGNWGAERVVEPILPFLVGNSYDIIIFVYDYGFQTYVQGNFVRDFAHRTPFEDIRILNVVGDIEVEMITYTRLQFSILLSSFLLLFLCYNCNVFRLASE